MKKVESNLKNMVIVLTGVAVLTGAVLAIVNKITEEKIEKQAQIKKMASVYEALASSADSITIAEPDTLKMEFEGKECIFEVYRANTLDEKEYGIAVKSTTQGFGGPYTIMVGFDNDGKVKGYKLLQQTETPGLGDKSKTWFQKGANGDIIGKQAGELKVKQDGGDVDAITASTITSRAFLRAVNQAYNAVINKDKDATTGASNRINK